jgi:hypothetical protein
MVPFDARRTFGAPEYFARLTKDRRLLTSWVLKPNVGPLALTGCGRLLPSTSAIEG